MTPRLVSSFATPPVFCPARRLLAVASPRLVCSFFARSFLLPFSQLPSPNWPPRPTPFLNYWLAPTPPSPSRWEGGVGASLAASVDLIGGGRDGQLRPNKSKTC